MHLCIAIALVATGITSGKAGQAETVLFDRDVRPILASQCFSCHGPDEGRREADLRLDTQAGMLADLGGYQAVVPSSPHKSQLYLRITAADPDDRMPPVGSEYRLSAAQIDLIQRWIEQGARWQAHWAFAAPVRPPVPEVQQDDWVRNAIDHFVLARLEAHGMHPSPAAGRRTLIRRVTFDLTGLPPRLQEVTDFIADTSPDAYEQVVDRLLSSPHYGEHRARFWLDVARYGDTHGLHVDNYREMWPYRDWVINAYNANMPYDQFVTQQLAGDLEPAATLEQLVATGFNRCHVTTNEGGSITEEVYVRNVVDRVSTTGTALLGLTLGCAVCHDHKFDPITQKDFYQLFAFFNDLDGPEMDGNTSHPAPIVRVPTSAQAERLATLRGQMAAIERLREQRIKADGSLFANGIGLEPSQLTVARTAADLDVRDGLVVHCDMDEGEGNAVHTSVDRVVPGAVKGTSKWIPGRAGGGLEFSSGGYVDLGNLGDFDEDEPFSYGAWIRASADISGAMISKMNVRDLEKGYELAVNDGRIVARFNGRWPGYAIKVTTREQFIRADTWRHVFVTYNGTKLARGVVMYVDGQPQPVDINCDSLHTEGSLQNDKPLLLGRCDTEAPLIGGCLDDVRLYARSLRDAEVRAVYLYSPLAPLLEIPTMDWTDQQRQALRALLVIRRDPIYGELTDELEKLRGEYDRQWLAVATTPVFRERHQPRDAFVLIRGQYDQRGARVRRQTPAALPPMDDHLPRNRLGLARWLFSSDHPLTGRVAVNRIWQQLFGNGIVETSEDFGIQGTLPSHPELLDWLAVEFRERGWDVKFLIKQIVMSATYRQSSRSTAELNRRDPGNRLLARGPRFRLDAEMLRDQALAISGLWYDQIGGPSVKPPQPDGLWRAVGIIESDTAQFEADHGPEKVYRRSLYTFWKRTAPPPQMTTFDAPSRESCTVRRERTNTPLQALLLMNDPQYVEAARHFAQRVLKEAGATPRARAKWAFEHVTLRPPDADELDELLATNRDLSLAYEADPAAAKRLITIGESQPDDFWDSTELATWTMMANLMFNLDEVLTKE